MAAPVVPAGTITLTIDEKPVTARPGEMVLEVCRREGIRVPTLCFLKGISTVGACRLCVVEMEGASKLFAACSTPVAQSQTIRTNTDRLRKNRRLTLELLFAERNHVCAVCVANYHCELQDLAHEYGMDRVRFRYLFPDTKMDTSHKLYNIDHNRCIMCTRCVRVCDEVEGAHVWDISGRGYDARVIGDFDQPWAESKDCTSCGKCVTVCPTGALWNKQSVQHSMKKTPDMIAELTDKRGSLI